MIRSRRRWIVVLLGLVTAVGALLFVLLPSASSHGLADNAHAKTVVASGVTAALRSRSAPALSSDCGAANRRFDRFIRTYARGQAQRRTWQAMGRRWKAAVLKDKESGTSVFCMDYTVTLSRTR